MDPNKLVYIANLKPDKLIQFITISASMFVYIPHMLIIFGIEKVIQNFTQYVLLAIFLSIFSLSIYIKMTFPQHLETFDLLKKIYFKSLESKDKDNGFEEMKLELGTMAKRVDEMLPTAERNKERNKLLKIRIELIKKKAALKVINHQFKEAVLDLETSFKQMIENDEISLSNIISYHWNAVFSSAIFLQLISAILSFVFLLLFVFAQNDGTLGRFLGSSLGTIFALIFPWIFIVVIVKLLSKFSKNYKNRGLEIKAN